MGNIRNFLINKILNIVLGYLGIVKIQEGLGKRLEKRNRLILDKYFDNNLVVRNGPFRGMKYVDESNWSSILPKIFGSYEEPIQKWVEESINNNYKRIIDVGCSEGYYAVGFAVKCKDSIVYAYDTNKIALSLCKKMSRLNNVESRMRLRSLCTEKEINSLSNFKTLIFCDIEGSENKLLNPVVVESLRDMDIIVESHDIFYKGTTERLIKRFSTTHKIEIVIDYPRSLKSDDRRISTRIMEKVVDEMRPKNMRWLRMISLNKK